MVSENEKQKIEEYCNQIKEKAISEERVETEQDTTVYSLLRGDGYKGVLKIYQPKKNNQKFLVQISDEYKNEDGKLNYLVYIGTNNGLQEINKIKFTQPSGSRTPVAGKGKITREQNSKFIELLEMYATNK